MHVDLMRWVDYWVGVPICVILSIYTWILKLLGIDNLKGYKPKKILFLELSEMGSTVLAYSAMKKAKELFNAEIYFMIFEENKHSVDLLNVVPKKNILTIRSKKFTWLFFDTFRAMYQMRKRKIDTVIDLELFSRYTSILTFFSGAKAKVGFYKYHMEGLNRGNFQTHKVEYNPHYHISRAFMSLVYALSDDVTDIPLVKRKVEMKEVECAKVLSSGKEIEIIRTKIREIYPKYSKRNRIVLLNPNASQLLPIRKWPIKKFMKLAKEILKIDNVIILVTGVKAEKEDADAICNYVQDDRCIDFTGQTSFKELIHLYNTSNVLVTNDSGPAHFSSLSSIKTIVMFGPETPNLYGPIGKGCTSVTSDLACSPCVSAFNHRKTPCKNNVCLQKIPVNMILNLVKDRLR